MSMHPDLPKIAHEPISVLLPVFNQAAALNAVVGGWLRELDRLNRAYELMIVDDGSSDATGTIADQLAATRPTVRVLRHDRQQGQGASLRTGLAAAQCPLLLTLSCDYPYQPIDLKKLLAAIDAVHIVLGVRTDPVPDWMRRLGRVYRLLVRILVGIPLEVRPGWRGWKDWRRGRWLRWAFGLRMSDPLCALKLYRREIFERFPIQSDGEFAQAEILAKANFAGRLMSEVPLGRLAGHFRGTPEPPAPGESFAAEARRLFQKPLFTARQVETTAMPGPVDAISDHDAPPDQGAEAPGRQI